jgi:hypothetical protein
MTFAAIVTGTGLRNDDGSSRARVIRRRCGIGSEVVLRKSSTSRESSPVVAVYLPVRRFFGLLRSSYAQIGDLDPRAAASIVARLEASGEIRARVKSVYAPEEKDNPRVSLFID